jgi:hypothetical protein
MMLEAGRPSRDRAEIFDVVRFSIAGLTSVVAFAALGFAAPRGAFSTTWASLVFTSAYTSLLVGEVSSVRLALGQAPVDDPIDRAIESFPAVPGVADDRGAGGGR